MMKISISSLAIVVVFATQPVLAGDGDIIPPNPQGTTGNTSSAQSLGGLTLPNQSINNSLNIGSSGTSGVCPPSGCLTFNVRVAPGSYGQPRSLEVSGGIIIPLGSPVDKANVDLAKNNAEAVRINYEVQKSNAEHEKIVSLIKDIDAAVKLNNFELARALSTQLERLTKEDARSYLQRVYKGAFPNL